MKKPDESGAKTETEPRTMRRPGAFARLFGRPARAPEAEPGLAPYGADQEALKQQAQSPLAGDRAEVAGNPAAPPELLFYLARDPDAAVRRAIAVNQATPRQADMILAMDEDPSIRASIAEKVAAQVNDMNRSEANQLWQITIQVLEALARDDVPRVRRLVAEAARGVPDMPPPLIEHLARDREGSVAVTALGHSQSIPSSTLIEIVEQAPTPAVVAAVAERPSLDIQVVDAVVQRGDDLAITLLLSNRTANFSAETLDRVVERAPAVEAWHEPLVTRPNLTDNAAIRLASFVADRLVQTLRRRSDLKPETGDALTIVANSRQLPAIAAMSSDGEMNGGPIVAEIVDEQDPVLRARRQMAQGTLCEDDLIEALSGERDFTVAALAMRAKLRADVVAKILSSHSAKGLTALAWQAGYTMRLALQMQVRLARLPPKARLNPSPGGGFPLTPEAMQWQIEFFKSLVSDSF